MMLKMDSKLLFASLVLLLSVIALGVLPLYTPSVSVNFETTSRILCRGNATSLKQIKRFVTSVGVVSNTLNI